MDDIDTPEESSDFDEDEFNEEDLDDLDDNI